MNFGVSISLTGEGVRETLKKIRNHLPKMAMNSISSGTKVFDWEIPREWHVNEAILLLQVVKKFAIIPKTTYIYLVIVFLF